MPRTAHGSVTAATNQDSNACEEPTVSQRKSQATEAGDASAQDHAADAAQADVGQPGDVRDAQQERQARQEADVQEMDLQEAQAAPPARPPRHIEQDTYETGWFGRLMQRIEASISRLSTRNNFWHRICSWIFLPLAYRSGIKFTKGDESTFSAILPFRKFNKNWYNAMAGGAAPGQCRGGGRHVRVQKVRG